MTSLPSNLDLDEALRQWPSGLSHWDVPKHCPSGTVSPYVPAFEREGLRALNAEQLLNADFPPRRVLLSPWLPEKGLAMIFAERGIGKTWVALNVAYAVASGGSYLGWVAPAPARVVYLDGEMPTATLQERFAAIVTASPVEATPDHFALVAADYQPDGLPDLADVAAQRFYDDVIRDASLVIVDNLSTLCRGLRENEADAWGPVQAWLLRMRAAGKSVLLIHHAGKGGSQRGTSRKEDVLDSVISLKRPVDYESSQGARFEVHYTKARGFFGDAAEPFEARFTGHLWETGAIARTDSDDALRALQDQGMSIRQIGERTGLPKTTVARRLSGGGA